MTSSRDQQDAWSRIAEPFGAAVEEYHRRRGADVASNGVRSNVRTNTELVPRRGDNLLALLERLAGVPSLDRLDVLDLGSGFGALAAYLSWSQRPRSVVAVDVRTDYVAGARTSAEAAGLADRLEFREGDMRTLDGLADACADVALLNNSFIYLPTAADMHSALRSIHRVVRPGGHVLLYHANRWQLREPFTKDPIVHLLPAPIARRVSARTGWRHNHGRVRLISPVELAVRLRATGFDCVRVGAVGPRGIVTRRAAIVAGFYGVAARRR